MKPIVLKNQTPSFGGLQIPACTAGREDSGHGSPATLFGRTEEAHGEGRVLLCQPEAGGDGLKEWGRETRECLGGDEETKRKRRGGEEETKRR